MRITWRARMATKAAVVLFAMPLALAELYPKAPGPYRTVVDDGHAKAAIVLSHAPSEFQRFAAEQLSAMLEKISGVRLPIFKGTPHGVQFCFFLGDKLKADRPVDWQAMGRDGFLMRSVPGGLLLCGNEDIGTVYSVYAFLEEQLGCRWFFPHAVGTVIPRATTIRVGRIDSVEIPDYRFRHVGGCTRDNWGLKNRLTERLTVAGKQYSKVWGTAHTFFKLLPMETYHEAHPEYFAEMNGVRSGPMERKSHGPQICTSNPEARRLTAEKVLAIFRDDPLLEMVNVGPNDGLRFCECTRCRSTDEGRCTWVGAAQRPEWRGVLSRRMMLFYNSVARYVRQRAPDKLVKVMFYSWYQEPPTDRSLRLAPNTLLMLTHSGNPSAYEKVYPSCYNHPIDDPNCRPNRERFYPAIREWARRAPVLGIYEYYYKASICHVLFPILHTIRSDVPTYYKLGARYFYTQGTASNAASYGLNYYVTAKLLWDIDTDVDALLEDFYEKFYADAREPMRQYHQLLERWMAERGGDVLGWPFYTVKVFAPANVRKARALLDQAFRMTDGPLVRERIRLQQLALRYAESCAQLASLAQKASALTTRWRLMPGAQKSEVVRAIAEKQNEIRQFMNQHAKDNVIGKMAGSYVKLWLSPRVVSLAPNAQRSVFRQTLQRTEWAKGKGLPSPKLPPKCDLWIYANDLDASAKEAEHELWALDADRRPVKLTGFPDRKQACNRRNGVC